MIKWEIRVLLGHLLEQGLSKTAIARQLGLNRRTIDRWIADGQLERDVATAEIPWPVRRSRPPKLELFKPIICTRLESYPELSAVRLFEELKAAGYSGGISQLREYVATVRPKPAPKRSCRRATSRRGRTGR